MSAHPVALVTSLGEPPMHGGEEARLHIGKVVDRSAGLAVALAVSADLLGRADD